MLLLLLQSCCSSVPRRPPSSTTFAPIFILFLAPTKAEHILEANQVRSAVTKPLTAIFFKKAPKS